MDQALDNRLDRLDSRTARRTLALFAATSVLAMLVSPALVLYELAAGVSGLVVSGLLARVVPGRATMTATVVFAGVVTGCLPYLLAAALLV
ncbi:hypothetical protein [Streptomyces sp. 7-21]|jgi:hypothetical protein|uniref:hypothetical protein n=1 Tax=Streptomyces sp. 7-21 TaxID=2802283 RepID=UPI00191E5D4E|nr:hypothetical protein [Streptomyces sp. 7-21]MBL1067064.1 hypothetical protein [Streptomyces sp. 7-21]